MWARKQFDRTFDDAWNSFRTMEHDFLNLFRRVGMPTTTEGTERRLTTGETTRETLPFWNGYPPIDAWLTKNDTLCFRAELPGMNPNELDIQVVNDELIIRGERRFERETDERNYLVREVGCGRFERRFHLPEGTDTRKIEARFEYGVLELTLPAAETMRPKKIEVKTGGTPKKIKAA